MSPRAFRRECVATLALTVVCYVMVKEAQFYSSNCGYMVISNDVRMGTPMKDNLKTVSEKGR